MSIIHPLRNGRKKTSKPCRRRVIVKMLGRGLRYKAFQNRLHQMWARRGIMNIVNLGQEYYLVTFTCEEDQKLALMEGHWLIYDHYL